VKVPAELLAAGAFSWQALMYRRGIQEVRSQMLEVRVSDDLWQSGFLSSGFSLLVLHCFTDAREHRGQIAFGKLQAMSGAKQILGGAA